MYLFDDSLYIIIEEFVLEYLDYKGKLIIIQIYKKFRENRNMFCIYEKRLKYWLIDKD